MSRMVFATALAALIALALTAWIAYDWTQPPAGGARVPNPCSETR